MKKLIVVLAVFSIMFTGCFIKPVKKELTVEIEPNETAFLVPLEGASKASQGKFMSLEFLEEAKIAAKRVTLPQRTKKIGRWSGSIEWIPTVRVIKVDRTPITRSWTNSNETGTNTSNEAFWVESSDSIAFAIGGVITCAIPENSAAVFLYNYSGKPLSKAIDEDVRGYIQGILAREFGNLPLFECRTMKSSIFDAAFEATVKQFAKFGIEVRNFGLSEGLKYDDKEIQDAINRNFTAEMDIQVAKQETLAQEQRNIRIVAEATALREAAEEFAKAQEAQTIKIGLEIKRIQANATLKAAERWSGNLPASILPDGSNLLFGLSSGSTE